MKRSKGAVITGINGRLTYLFCSLFLPLYAISFASLSFPLAHYLLWITQGNSAGIFGVKFFCRYTHELKITPGQKRTKTMRYLHTMIRAADLDKTLSFFVDHLGLVEVRRYDSEQGRFTLVFLAAPRDADEAESKQSPLVEITYNWDPETYNGGRNFGHLAYRVDDIYATCQRLMDGGVTINRPPRDGRMAFVRSPDGISIELLQDGEALAVQEPWVSMENIGTW